MACYISLLLSLCWLTACRSSSCAADYQFAVPVAGEHSDGRALLWIPPTCHHLRGLLLGNQVILEKPVGDDPRIRAACARTDLGIVICYDTPLGYFDYHQGADRVLLKILADLADQSGYPEVATAPLLPFGHSGDAIFAWNVAYWRPTNTLAVVTLHAATTLPPAWDKQTTADGIPVLAVSGEYESWGNPAVPLDKHWRWLRGELLSLRSRYDAALVSEIVQPGASHFNWDELLAKEVALFIDHAARARLPVDPATASLRKIPLESGWLTDQALMTPSRYKPAPYLEYPGDPTLAFWHLDHDLAMAAENYDRDQKGKRDQRVTFVVDGQPLPAAWIEEHPFQPLADGLTVKVAADFLTHTPAGVRGAGQPLGHAEGPIQFRLIGGWGGGGEQVGADTFRIRFDHFGINRRACNLMVMAFHPGDKQYKYSEQPAQIAFPLRLTNGPAQTIQFEPLPDQPAKVKTLALHARSDAGLPVHFLVEQGPAEVQGEQLIFTQIPPRSKFPVQVAVVAWQCGRLGASPVQTAEPVRRIFNLLSP